MGTEGSVRDENRLAAGEKCRRRKMEDHLKKSLGVMMERWEN